AHDRVQEIEREIEGAGCYRRAERYALRLHLGREVCLTLDAELHGLVEIVRRYPGAIVVALQELVPVGDPLLLPAEHDPVDERHRLAGIAQQPSRLVPGLALRWVRLAAEIRIALEHHAGVRIVFGEHVWSGSNRIPVERDVASLIHAALGIESIRLPGNRREERH